VRKHVTDARIEVPEKEPPPANACTFSIEPMTLSIDGRCGAAVMMGTQRRMRARERRIRTILSGVRPRAGWHTIAAL
jgi:hypothetical protein